MKMIYQVINGLNLMMNYQSLFQSHWQNSMSLQGLNKKSY